ncbi:PaaX family transcriptional regulator C-terminal domain-containing protein [Marmoricola sp. URHA0025 HA25]
MSPGTGAGTHTGTVRLRPLTARSAILSLLLGAHPPSATVSELVAFGRQVDINESALRAALTRMVASGDLLRENGRYTLPERLLERQRRQDEAMQVPAGPWDGTWRIAAVVSSGKDASSRLNLRRSMLSAHFGELREGLWMRPDNLAWRPDPEVADDLELMTARPEHDADHLAHHLFQPGRWATVGRSMLDQAGRVSTARDRLTVFAAVVRHLTHDPLLPAELLPADWPGTALRDTYDAFRDEVIREWRRS